MRWLVSCADGEGKVSLFDSMFASNSGEIDVQLAQVYPQKQVFKYCRQKMQLQKGSSDCGLFAAAVCTALVFGENPSNAMWDQSRMRAHLTECLINQQLSLFPTLHTGLGQFKFQRRNLMSFPLYCICNMPEYSSKYMIKCMVCNDWFHNPCVNFSDDSRPTKRIAKLFKCPNCESLSVN